MPNIILPLPPFDVGYLWGLNNIKFIMCVHKLFDLSTYTDGIFGFASGELRLCIFAFLGEGE